MDGIAATLGLFVHSTDLCLKDLFHLSHVYCIALHSLACGLIFIGFMKRQESSAKVCKFWWGEQAQKLNPFHLVVLYESSMGGTDPDFGDQIFFFFATSFFSSSPRSSHEGVSHASFISLSWVPAVWIHHCVSLLLFSSQRANLHFCLLWKVLKA